MNQQDYIRELREVFEGDPWYGEALMPSLRDIPVAQITAKAYEGGHSIAVLVLHLLAWRKLAIEKIKGRADYDIPTDSVADWPILPEHFGMQQWQQLLAELEASQQQLESLIIHKDQAWLSVITPGKPYNNAYLLRGLLQHDVYHLGQIRLIMTKAKTNLHS